MMHDTLYLEHIHGPLLGGEVGEGVAVLGGGAHQTRPDLQELLHHLRVVILNRNISTIKKSYD